MIEHQVLSNPSFQSIWEDEEVMLLRGQLQNGQGSGSVLAYTSVSEHPLPGTLARLRRHFDLRAELSGTWAARPLEFGQRGSRTVLLMDDPGGYPLAKLLNGPLGTAEFLKLAIAIATALERVHEAGLIHKDIKPSNILTDMTAGEAWLTGFGLASRLPRERQTPMPPEVIAGSFAYMAPEQTGRMNRSVDARTDLYSLGVTFYEMLTGELPFVADDAMEWIHCHVARQPIAPSARKQDIPEVISAIVMKLLSKAAEDRYQTAQGLLHDLRVCLDQWTADKRISDFPLGSQDTTGLLRFREKLYGRDDEVQTLVDALDDIIAHGTSGVVLVAGFSGIGKSAVVNELHRALVPPRGIFAAGKFDQYQRGIPYAPLAQAFQGLVKQLLSKGESDLEQWRSELKQAVGSTGQLLVNLIPALELIIGPQPRVPDLSGPESQARFNRVFVDFLRVFAKQEHPLMLFLDDLQWLDAGTLELFQHLATQPDLHNLLLIGAFRDNEVGPDHPLTRRLETIRAARSDIKHIKLAGIVPAALAEMIADAMRSSPSDVGDLVDLIVPKTGGSPFVTIQFVSALADQDLLSFDDRAERWSWDPSHIRTKQVGDNVVDLMIERLKRLPPASLAMLTEVASLGNNVSIDLLSRISELPERDLDVMLGEALRLDLLFRVDDSYVFAHDRVQEAAYAMLGEAERKTKHRYLGERMLAVLDDAEADARVFELANHFERAGPAEDGLPEPAVADVFVRAGRKARASAAFSEACDLLALARARLGKTGWNTDYELSFQAALQHAECLFLSGKIPAADDVISEVLPLAQTKAHKAAIYRLRVELFVVQSANEKAIECGIEALRIFDIDLHAHPNWDMVKDDFQRFDSLLDGRSLSILHELPQMTDPDLLGLLALLAELLPPAFYTDYNLTVQITFKMGALNLQHGKAIYQGYAWLGWIMGHAFGRWEEGYQLGKQTLDFAVVHGSVLDTSRLYHMVGMLSAWTRPLSGSMELYRSAYRLGVPAGDHYFSTYASAHVVLTALQLGANLQTIHDESVEFLEFAESIGFRDGADLIVSTERITAALLGLTKSLSSFSDDKFDDEGFITDFKGTRMSTVVYWHWTRKLMLHVIAGEYEAAIRASDKGDPGPWLYKIMQIQNLDYQYFTVLAIASHLPNAPAEDQENLWARLRKHYAQIKVWAEETGNGVFVDKLALTSAEIARLEGRHADAERLYEQSIQAANENGFIHNEALSYELAARFHAERGFDRVARMYLREARQRYLSWGAVAKVRQIDLMHPGLVEDIRPTAFTTTSVAYLERLELATVLEVSQAISGELVFERMIDRLMRLAIEHAGAERATLLLSRSGSFKVVAEAYTADGDVNVSTGENVGDGAQVSQTIVQYVLRTKEDLVLEDAMADTSFQADSQLKQRQVRSVLAMPLIKQTNVIGILYLENNLATRAFTPNRIAVLKLIASQAAMALENTQLYRDLAEREAKMRCLVESDVIGIVSWKTEGGITEANDAFLNIVGMTRDDLDEGRVSWIALSPEDGRENDEKVMKELISTGIHAPWEKEFVRPVGGRVPVLIGAATFGGPGSNEGVAFVLDLTEQKRAEERIRESERLYSVLQAELAHANRVATLGQLSASLAHEVRQPLAGVVSSATAGVNWLSASPPNVAAALRALERVVGEGHRAAAVLEGTRTLVKKTPFKKEPADLNAIIVETVGLVGAEARRKRVSIDVETEPSLPMVAVDRVQLQQVVLNLLVNAIDAIAPGTSPDSRIVTVKSGRLESGQATIIVSDLGSGIAEDIRDKLFDAFATTKEDGLGMGLAICRSIAKAHGGRLWAEDNKPRGASFHLDLPI